MLLTFNQKYGSLWTVQPKKFVEITSYPIQWSRKLFTTYLSTRFQQKGYISLLKNCLDLSKNLRQKKVYPKSWGCSQTRCPLITYKRITFWRWNPIFLCHITFISANKLSSRTWLSMAAVSLLPTVNNNFIGLMPCLMQKCRLIFFELQFILQWSEMQRTYSKPKSITLYTTYFRRKECDIFFTLDAIYILIQLFKIHI